MSLCELTCFRSLESTQFNLASRIASSPHSPTSTNAELRLRCETSDGEGGGSVVADAAEMFWLDGPERVKQVIKGWEKSVGKEASCSSTRDILVTDSPIARLRRWCFVNWSCFTGRLLTYKGTNKTRDNEKAFRDREIKAERALTMAMTGFDGNDVAP